MSVSTSIRVLGGLQGAGEVFVYAVRGNDLLGAYEAYLEDGANLERGYALVIAEAGLESVAPAFSALPTIRGWVREIDLTL